MKTNPFLTRKPRIYVVGDDKLTERIAKKLGEEYWLSYLAFISSVIHTNEDVPYGLLIKWIGNKLCLVEAPETGVRFDEQGYYAEFHELISKAEESGKEEDIKKLFEYSPPIYDYMPQNDRELEIFVMLARTVIREWKWREKVKKQLRELIEKL